MKQLKSIFSVLLSLCILCSIVSVPGMAAEGATPAGTPITTAEEFQRISEDLSGTYYLANDITLDASFQPIGWTENAFLEFTGTFDGNGHTISGLEAVYEGTFSVINPYQGIWSYDNYETHLGLFAKNSGTIQNLTVIAPNIQASENVGPIAAVNLAGGKVLNCHVEGGSVYGDMQIFEFVPYEGHGDNIGGLVGLNQGEIYQCSSTATVVGWSSVGGLVGRNEGTVSQSFAKGNVNWAPNEQVHINRFIQMLTEGSHNNGNPIYSRAGGFVGTNTGTIRDCYSTGSNDASNPGACVVGGNSLGGFAGYSSGSLVNCYSAVKQMTFPYDGFRQYCLLCVDYWGYPYHAITYGWNGKYIHPFIGAQDGTTANCYYVAVNQSKFPQAAFSEAYHGESRSDAQMKTQATYENYDFSNVWTMDGATEKNFGMPIFGWEVGGIAKPDEYTYTLSYDKNTEDAVTNLPDPLTVSATGTEDTYDFVVADAPARAGYAFAGWNTASDGSGTSYASGSTITIAKDTSVTLYAIWNELCTLTLSYDTNTKDRVNGMPETETYTGPAETHVFTVSAKIPTREGYKFVGWTLNKDAQTLVGATVTATKSNPNVTLYAVWEEACKHDNIDWTDNGDGTHTGTCHDCGTVITSSEAHTLTYKINDDGTHTATCTKCDFTETKPHTYVNHHCVCGAEEGFFTVYYTSENNATAHKIYLSDCTSGYSFTDKVHTGYLYGGVYTDNTYMETSAYTFGADENGIHFTPKAGDVYYVREINEKYSKMKLVASYKDNNVLNIYLMAGLDGTYMDVAKNVQGFMAIGFLENAGDNTNVEGIDFSGYNKKNASAYYNSITINVGGQKFKFAPTAEGNLGFGLNAGDKLYYYALGKDYVNNNRDGKMHNVVPYYKTCDGVIVTGTEMCTFSIVSGETNVQGFVRTRVPSRVYSAN